MTPRNSPRETIRNPLISTMQIAILALVLSACGNIDNQSENNNSEINEVLSDIHDKISTNTNLCELPDDLLKILKHLQSIKADGSNQGWQETNCQTNNEETCDSVCLEQSSTKNLLTCTNSTDKNISRRECQLQIDETVLHCVDNQVFSTDGDQHHVSCTISGSGLNNFVTTGDNAISIDRNGLEWIDCDHNQQILLDSFDTLFSTHQACDTDHLADITFVCENGQKPHLESDNKDPLSEMCFDESYNSQFESFDTIRYLPVVIHRYLDPNNECVFLTNNIHEEEDLAVTSLSSPQVTTVFDGLNQAFSDFNIVFVPTKMNIYIEEVSAHNFTACELPETFDPTALNLYVTPHLVTPSLAGTFGTHIKGAIFSTSTFYPDIVIHEAAHAIGDLFEIDENCFPGSSACTDIVNSENCNKPVHGESDGICDTPPHPGLFGEDNPEGCENIEGTCDFECGSDPEGTPYEILPNYMYTQDPFPSECDHLKTFTPGQKAVINCTLQTKAQMVQLLTDQRPQTVVTNNNLRERCQNLE